MFEIGAFRARVVPATFGSMVASFADGALLADASRLKDFAGSTYLYCTVIGTCLRSAGISLVAVIDRKMTYLLSLEDSLVPESLGGLLEFFLWLLPLIATEFTAFCLMSMYGA